MQMSDRTHETKSRPIADLFAELRQRSRIVDLSPVIASNMPGWSTHPCMSIIDDARNHAQHGYYAQTLVMSEHTGAHVDAAHHFHAGLTDRTVDAYAPDELFGTFKKLDLSRLDLAPGDLVGAAQIEAAEFEAGIHLDADDIVLLDWGWSRFFLPDEPDWEKRQWWADNSPGLAEDACRLLADRGISAIGADTAACECAVVDGELLSDFGHRTYFLPRGIPIVECLQRLDQLTTTGVFIAAPLRIHRGSGSPLRPIALCEVSD
jgi:kynurenine formamidase